MVTLDNTPSVPVAQSAPASDHGTPDPGLTGESITFNVFRGTPDGEQGDVSYQVPGVTGMVVLDAIHYIQHNLDTDLAARWNCKAVKCGSCSAEINGRPLLMCKTRIDELAAGPITVRPMKAFPLVKDLVTDVSRNYEINKEIPPFTAAPDDGTPWRIQQADIDRLFEFRKCIECFLCQDVCHINRTHGLSDRFYGPLFFVRVAGLEMHPKDVLVRPRPGTSRGSPATSSGSRTRSPSARAAIIEWEVARAVTVVAERDTAGPTIGALVRQAEAVRRQEVERTLARMPGVDAATADRIQQLTRGIVSKLLHAPISHLREFADDPGVALTLRDAFDLDTPDLVEGDSVASDAAAS